MLHREGSVNGIGSQLQSHYSISQEALLLQRDRATRHVSKFVQCFTRYCGLERFQTAKVTFKDSIGHIRFPISVLLQLCLYILHY